MLTLREQWEENCKRRKEGRPEVDRNGNEYLPKPKQEPRQSSTSSDWADECINAKRD